MGRCFSSLSRVCVMPSLHPDDPEQVDEVRMGGQRGQHGDLVLKPALVIHQTLLPNAGKEKYARDFIGTVERLKCRTQRVKCGGSESAGERL